MVWKSTEDKLDLSLDDLAADGKVTRGGNGNTRVFVGNLPYSTSWQDLKDHMRKAGEVLFCEILAEPGTALGSKGCGLVEFATPAAARRAISDLTDTAIQGRKIFVREDRETESQSNFQGGRRVFVGNLAYSVSWQDLKDHMRQCGEVLHCDILREPNTTLGSKGCGIVEFASASSAKRAIHEMTESMLKGRAIFVREDREEHGSTGHFEHREKVRFGRPSKPERFGRARSRSYSAGRQRWQPVGGAKGGYSEGGGSNRRVFVGNLAYSVTWQELKDHMRRAGDVLFCEILKERGTTLGSKGCAIVEYSNASEARRAIRSMTDTELRGRKMWVREDREEV